MTATMTSRQFNQDASGAKRLANEGPVVITDRGRPAHVLMTIEEFRRLRGEGAEGRSLVDLIAQKPTGGWEDEIEFDPPRFRDLPREINLD